VTEQPFVFPEVPMFVQLALSLICLALGASGGYAAGLFKIGFWLADETEDENDSEKARESLANLKDLTKRVSGQVAEHAKRVEDAQRDLDNAEGSTDAEPVAQAAEALRNANEQLQAELRKAQRDLEKQASELQSHRREARTDGLTQLLNRRAFDEEMSSLTARVTASGTDVSLLMMDIDHFKKFNDTYGHQLGDRVLKHVAHLVRETLLGMDVVAARYGGEEFAVIFSGSPHIAARVAEELRTAVEKSSLKHDGQTLSITLSVGLSESATGADAEELIARADTALYAAKRGGRNCGYYNNGERCMPIDELMASAAREKPVDQVAPAAAAAVGVMAAAEDRTLSKVEDAFDALEESLRDVDQDPSLTGRERRRHERKTYARAHLIAPIVGGRAPSPEMFEEVQFFDLSAGGFGLVLEAPPNYKNFVVQLSKADGTVYALAEVVRMRRADQSADNGTRAWEVGCRFTGKLQAPRASDEEQPAETASAS
jgi:diguanylate cyclase